MVSINHEKCIGCGACARECFRQSIDIENGKALWKDRYCTDCGHCLGVCPKDAVTINRYPDEIYDLSNKENYIVDTDKLRNMQRSRRSLRRFSKKTIEQNKLEQILDAARYSATGRNLQELSFVVIQDQIEKFRTLLYSSQLEQQYPFFTKKIDDKVFNDIKTQVNNLTPQEERITYHAPVMIGVISNDIETFRSFEGMAYVDVGLAAANMEHLANSMGIGAFYGGSATGLAKENSRIREFLGLKKNQHLMMCMFLGYPDEKQKFYRTSPRLKREIVWK